MCRRKLVSYCLSKRFVILEQDSLALNNMPLKVKKRIHTSKRFDRDSVIRYSAAITYVANTLKKIYLGETLLNEFTSTYYDYNNDTFGILFQNLTASAVDNIYHPAIFKECKDNMDREV